VVIGFVSFYLICTITLLLNDGNNTIYKSNIQSSAGKMGGITQNNTKSIHINKAKSWESKQSSGSSKNCKLLHNFFCNSSSTCMILQNYYYTFDFSDPIQILNMLPESMSWDV
jgi:hypothetical protein